MFSLAPIQLAVHLGFALSDRVDATLYQFHRDRRSWAWGEEEAGPSISVSGLPDVPLPGTPDVIIRVSLSAHIAAEDAGVLVPGGALQIEIGVDDPGVLWLKRPEQLAEPIPYPLNTDIMDRFWYPLRTLSVNAQPHAPTS